ncbi:MAG: ATP-binding protein, partial [Chloroflexi bacterium]|nr:ATP-binding protein [Chloroflexota bacterium]
MTDTADSPVRMGIVVGGSLSRGVEVRLDATFPVERVKVGGFVTIRGQSQRFFGIVSDVALETSDQSVRGSPPDMSDPFVASVISGTGAYAIVNVVPQLVLNNDPLSIIEGPQSARSIPAHFTPVFQASDEDIRMVFGAEDERRVWVGSPLDMEETRVCLDLEELVKRSNGVFGKSGTGKSFLTRILLAGILQKGVAVNLVFDMHNEYGWQGSSESGPPVKGLKQLFSSQVAVFTVDAESSLRRGVSPDAEVQIGYGEIEPQDIETLAETLNLTPQGVSAVYGLVRKFGQDSWLEEFLKRESREELSTLADETSENFQVLFTLHRRLRVLGRMEFLTARAPDEAVRRILEYLERGTHVVLEFGRHGNDLTAYILVANLLTRRIHERYVHRMEEAAGNRTQEPKPLVITIEEAHRFLTPSVSSQTIFGTIAREMRKYKVTLLVVDQRPSGIDEEVLSQLGTRLVYLLDNERDVDAVLSGASGARELRTVLSRLESQQQALMFGHALPMPVVVRTREYGSEESYREFGLQDESALKQQAEE